METQYFWLFDLFLILIIFSILIIVLIFQMFLCILIAVFDRWLSTLMPVFLNIANHQPCFIGELVFICKYFWIA